MKVLLQDQETKRFAKADGRWVAEEEATDFKTPLHAMSFCHRHRYPHTALVILEGDQKHEMPLRCDE